jgi:hypothetical protein
LFQGLGWDGIYSVSLDKSCSSRVVEEMSFLIMLKSMEDCNRLISCITVRPSDETRSPVRRSVPAALTLVFSVSVAAIKSQHSTQRKEFFRPSASPLAWPSFDPLESTSHISPHSVIAHFGFIVNIEMGRWLETYQTPEEVLMTK